MDANASVEANSMQGQEPAATATPATNPPNVDSATTGSQAPLYRSQHPTQFLRREPTGFQFSRTSTTGNTTVTESATLTTDAPPAQIDRRTVLEALNEIIQSRVIPHIRRAYQEQEDSRAQPNGFILLL